MKLITKSLLILFIISVVAAADMFAQVVITRATGANAAGIQATVDAFRTSLGGANNGVGGSFRTGRREINWDGVPDTSANPNFLTPDFFNTTSPRGLVMNALEFETGSGFNDFMVSADSSNPTATPTEFGDLNAAYPAQFVTFSAQRLFAIRDTSAMEVLFLVPGTKIPATVNGFGVVFVDVDEPTGGRRTAIRCYDKGGVQLVSAAADVLDAGLSFMGLKFDENARAARCTIEAGNNRLGASFTDVAGTTDIVVMDDFIYGEPRSTEFHTGDFDGDGITDSNIFRPSNGTWFSINSGSNTVSIVQWGQNGDIPVDGDFDGDGLADQAIFRPSLGQWWLNRSTAGTLAMTFGANGDKPVTGDYDKDGKTDVALWRPSSGEFFVLRSSSNFTTFFAYPFGMAGDIPVQGGAQ